MAAPPSRKFHVCLADVQLRWSRDIQPVVRVWPGEDVHFDLADSSGGQITPASTAADISALRLELCDPISGPVFVEGAEPGDVLEVEIVHLETRGWGWTAVIPGFGLLADEFPAPQLQHYVFAPGDAAIDFGDGIRVPQRPFLGVCGVAPGEPGAFSTIPPRADTGGNVDCRYLTAGARLLLPVRVAGALFSCGDGHAAQGDGEVCGTAIETPMRATLRFAVRKGLAHVTSPHYDTSGCVDDAQRGGEGQGGGAGSYATMGIHEDLREACRCAVRALVDYLVATRGLSRERAYMLASVAADLKVVEAVDMPNYAVAASIPLSIFAEGSPA